MGRKTTAEIEPIYSVTRFVQERCEQKRGNTIKFVDLFNTYYVWAVDRGYPRAWVPMFYKQFLAACPYAAQRVGPSGRLTPHMLGVGLRGT